MSTDMGAKGNHSRNINRVCLEEDIKIVTNNLARTKCSSYQKPSPKRKDSSVLVSHKEIGECNNNKRGSNARNRLSRRDKHHLQKGRGRKANEENGLTGSPKQHKHKHDVSILWDDPPPPESTKWKGLGEKNNKEEEDERNLPCNSEDNRWSLQETLIGANVKANQRRRQRSYEFQR